MPLINILGFHGNMPPLPIVIEDCTEHMFNGGKKDASYIARLMEGVVLPYDRDEMVTDIFYFDGERCRDKNGNFYSTIQVLRLKTVLRSTIHQPKFIVLEKNECIRAAIFDISDDVFFKALYVLLRAVYPALLVLRVCDSNKPFMDQVYYLVHLSTEAMKK